MTEIADTADGQRAPRRVPTRAARIGGPPDGAATDDSVVPRPRGRWLEAIADLTSDLVAILDRDGHFLYVNAAGQGILDRPGATDLPPGTGPDYVVETGAELNASMGTALAGSGSWSGDLHFRRGSGSPRPVAVELVAHPAEDGTIAFYSLVGRDQTERVERRAREATLFQRLELVFDRTPDFATITDPAGVALYVNPAMRDTFGVDVGFDLDTDSLIDEEASPRWREAIVESLASHGASISELVFVTPDGRRVPVSQVTVLHRDEAGRALFLSTTARDITVLKDVQDRIEARERWFRSLVQDALELVTVRSEAGEFLYVSPSIERVLGYTVEEYRDLPLDAFMHPDDLALAITSTDAIRSSPGAATSFLSRGKRADGTWCWLENRVVNLLADPMIGGFVTHSHDVTDRLAAEQGLRESEERFRTLVQNSSDIITVLDVDGTQRFVSPAVERILGFTPEELVGTSAFALMHDDERDVVIEEFLNAFVVDRDTEPLTFRLRHRDGTWRWVEAVVSDLMDHEAVKGLVVTTRSVHERHLADEARRRSEAQLDAIVQNLSDVVHVVGLDGRIVYSTTASRPGGPGQVGETFLNSLPAVHPEDADRVQEHVRDLLAGNAVDSKITLRARWGRSPQYRVIEVLADDMRDVPDICGVVFTSRDVTKRRHAERLMAHQAQVLEMVARGRSLGDSLRAIAHAVERQLDDAWCAVLLRDGDQIRIGAAPELPAPVLDALASRAVDEISGTCAAAMGSGVLEVCTDLSRAHLEPHRRDTLLAHGIRACWSEPVFASDGREVLGAITIFHRDSRVPTPADLQVLQTAGPLAAIAIERKRHHDQLAHQAQHDPLTNLPNRTYFLDYLLRAIARAGRQHTSLAVLFLDLDRFKVVNDSLGHDAGDVVLEELAARLREVVRPNDTVARFGGDEFTILCEDLSPEDAEHRAIGVAERVLERVVDEPFILEGAPQFLSGSIGIAISPGADDQPDMLLRDADAAMYRAKEKGRARWELFDEEMRAAVMQRLATETALQQAINGGELILYFQAIVDLTSRRCVGAEALVRWQHPTRGLIAPVEFISLAEDTGLIVPLGAWVLDRACRQWAAWRRDGLITDDFVISVNLSGRQLVNPELIAVVKTALRDADIPASAVCFEITESVLMEDTVGSMVTVSELKGLGVGLSIDDFGTGYSSLGYLKRFPVDVVKIDRSFIHGLGSDPEDLAIIDAIVRLSHALGLAVVAEGVETVDQLDSLLELGCDRAQGFLFSPPREAAAIHDVLRGGVAPG